MYTRIDIIYVYAKTRKLFVKTVGFRIIIQFDTGVDGVDGYTSCALDNRVRQRGAVDCVSKENDI